jgi:hypothetical protein
MPPREVESKTKAIIVVLERSPNYHYLTLCVGQLMEAGVGMLSWGSYFICVRDGSGSLCVQYCTLYSQPCECTQSTVKEDLFHSPL